MSCSYHLAAAPADERQAEPEFGPQQIDGACRRHWLAQIGDWMERRRQCQALVDLDDRLLRDIGVTRLQAEQELRKSFRRI